MTAHPSRDAISVFRPLRNTLNWSNGLFKLHTCSHHRSKEEAEDIEHEDIHEIVVEPNEILVVAGGVSIQLSPNGGGRMVWQGFSTRPMLHDIYSSDALSFMKI